ncbi:hypothetical protein PVAP13_8KG344601 [Panicum virgatum]|uniref:Uncharacterized protein n=1 Tax=Panicum virgatum TaxID=38727 RepID=A0A8T0PJB0_PANVG|nr:hypothetical protein PVAP13_8KG344601 [Panicum virgatum]
MASPFGHFVEHPQCVRPRSLHAHVILPAVHCHLECHLGAVARTQVASVTAEHPGVPLGILLNTLWAAAKPHSRAPNATPLACSPRRHHVPPPTRCLCPVLALTWPSPRLRSISSRRAAALPCAHASHACLATAQPVVASVPSCNLATLRVRRGRVMTLAKPRAREHAPLRPEGQAFSPPCYRVCPSPPLPNIVWPCPGLPHALVAHTPPASPPGQNTEHLGGTPPLTPRPYTHPATRDPLCHVGSL